MRIVNTSHVPDIGTQVVIVMRERGHGDTILPDHPKWNRWNALASRLAKENRIEGTFVRADLRAYVGELLEAQLSYTNKEKKMKTIMYSLAISFCLIFVMQTILMIFGMGGPSYKEADQAYQRLSDQGFSDKQIYDMGKDK